MQEIDRRGYPIKVSVIANETDTGGESEPLADPQAYAEFVVRELELFFPVEAPVMIVTPNGFGVAGKHVRAGRLQPFPGGDGRSLLRGIAVPPLEADALARTAMLAVRQLAADAGRPLPEHVPAAKALAPQPGREARAARASTPGSGRSFSPASRCWPGRSTRSGAADLGSEKPSVRGSVGGAQASLDFRQKIT